MIVVVVSFLPNSSERRGRFQTMLHFGQNQVHNMSPVLLLALPQKSHGGIIELKKKKTKTTVTNLFGNSFSPCHLSIASIADHSLSIWFSYLSDLPKTKNKNQ